MRLVIVASHPVQYQSPLFRELSRRCDLHVLFAHRATASDQAAAGFNVAFEWDVDLTTGFEHSFLANAARRPGLEEFAGCDTPGIGDALRRLAPDAVLLMGWHLKCYWQAIWAAKRLSIPVMVRGDSHLETPRSIAKRLAKAVVYPLALRLFDRALYVGERSRAYWEHYRYPRDRMFFSPHCVDNDWFAEMASPSARASFRQQHSIDPNERVFLFVGKLVPGKRVADLVAAAQAVRMAGCDISIMVAGSGPLEPEIRELAADMGVRLIALGFCNQSQMPSVYAAADALVLPSESETWGLVANEALACGRPIIVSDACGCAPDLAADRTAGRVFRHGNVDHLAHTLRCVLDNPPSRQQIETKARSYSLAAAARGILDALPVRSDLTFPRNPHV